MIISFTRTICVLSLILGFLPFFSNAKASESHSREINGFSFCKNGRTDIAILLNSSASSVIKYAVKDIAEDFKESTGVMPQVANTLPSNATIILPIDLSEENPFFNIIEKKNSLDLSSIKGKWESFTIIPLKNCFKKGQNVLLVAGSDPRGTMYGLYEVSEKVLGTDPQKLWTDAPARKVPDAQWNYGTITQGPPTFKYRGWFINDENYLLAWKGPNLNDNKIEPEVWANIFETMCRMRANFYTIIEYGDSPDNKTLQLANDRGLYVMGSHMHMLIANTSHEWDSFVQQHYGKDIPYNWSSNSKEMIAFWEDAVKKHKDHLAIWPIGLKAKNDQDFCETDPGAPKTVEGRTKFTNEAIAAQVQLLNKYLDPTKGEPIHSYVMRGDPVNQFLTGKLEFPSNTVVLWPDNPSFGLMGRVPDAEDFKRVPLHGIFFHLTYCDNQWVQWVPLKQVQHELMKAVNAHATTMAEFNVGDIRELPMKIAMAMDFTYNTKKWKNNSEYYRTFTEKWCKKEYLPSDTKKIADLFEKYWYMEMPCRNMIVVEALSPYTVLPGNILESTSKQQDKIKALACYVDKIKLPTDPRFGKLGLEWLKNAAPEWDSFYHDVLASTKLVSPVRRQFYFDSFTLQVQTSRIVNHWGTDILSAFEAIKKQDFKKAAAYFNQAAQCMKEMKEERIRAEHGKWINWFRGEEQQTWYNHPWGFHIEREMNNDLKMAELLNTLSM